MGHEVFVCYDDMDREIADAVCSTFEENGIGTWAKLDDSPQKIIEAIQDSKCFVLIYSRDSRGAVHVATETDLAFSQKVPIIVFNIDDSKITSNLEYILETKKKIQAFPNPKVQLEKLVGETSKAIEKAPEEIKINSNNVKTIERFDPKRKENALKKYVKIAVPIVLALVVVYLIFIMPAGHHTTSEGQFAMNVTDVAVDGYKYTVYGESYNMPSDSINYIMNIQFFDKNDDVVYEVNSTADEFKSGVIWSGNIHDDNVTHVGFKLSDIDGKLLSKDNYVID